MRRQASMKEGTVTRSPTKRRVSWKVQKRRMQLQFLTNFGKELPASDDLYEQHEQRFMGLLQKLLDIRKSLDHYRTTALPAYCAACAALGADVWCVVSVDAVGKGTEAEKFRHAMCAINEAKEIKSHYFNADEVLSGALRFLDIHINAMKSVRSQISRRKIVKLEYDCYERKVAKLWERSASDSKILTRNIAKMERAKEALQTTTFDLYRVFAKYESERDTMLNGELEMVRQVMHGFYSKNAEATKFTIREELDRSAVENCTEEIFQQMVARELERDNQRTTSSALQQEVPAAPLSTPLEMLPTIPAAPVILPPPAASMNNPAASAPDMELSLELAQETGAAVVETKEAPQGQHSQQLQQHQQQQQIHPMRQSSPQEEPEDELSEKLRTIQLSRPKMPPTRHFKPKLGT